MQIHSDHRSIELNPNAVLQLLLFSDWDLIRNAAARALEPFVTANPLLLQCNTGSLEGLPRWERIAALLVASIVERHPRPEHALGCVAAESPSCTRVFRYEFDSATTVDCSGLECVEYARATFVLPSRQRSMFVRFASSICETLDPDRLPGKGWNVDQSAVWLRLPDNLTTRVTSWTKVNLVTPSGQLHGVFECDGARVIKQRMLPIDSSLLLRLESGALRGYLLTLVHQDRRVRDDRARDVVLSVELGGSMQDPPVFSLHRGELEPCLDLGVLTDVAALAFPLFGGATLRELDRLARRAGVWHGGFLRGSFAYHPLRTTAAASGSRAREVA